MQGDQWAVIVGVNSAPKTVGQPLRYAEDDARAMYETFVHPQTGTFDRAKVSLFTGADATWRAIKPRLRQIVMAAQPSDVLLVYFAGHAFVPEWGRQPDPYLVTDDLDIAAIRNEPDRGLRMTFLRRDVFEAFEGSSLLILDCCQAGTYIDVANRGFDASFGRGPQIDRHSALLSCPSGESARESNETRHGLLTTELLRALGGEAADASGRVNFAQMANFVAGQNLNPTPGHLMQTWGPTCTLTNLSGRNSSPPRSVEQVQRSASIVACENPLDRYAGTIIQLMGRMFGTGGKIPRQHPFKSGLDRLDIVRSALGAESAAVVAFGAHGLTVTDYTTRFNKDQLTPVLEQSRAFAFPNRVVWAGHVASAEAGDEVLCVPLHHDAVQSRVLVVVKPALSFLEMGEALAVLLNAVWKSDVLEDPAHAEIAVLTALRSSFGRLPASLYEHCFKLYTDVVSSFAMVFQPVLFLHPMAKWVDIESYEALARRSETENRAPLPMLHAAHVWGDRFVIERDSLLFGKSIAAYANAERQPGVPIKPVSVNVAVRSLLSDPYVALVKATLADVGLDPHKVTLEISEQDAIEPRSNEIWTEEPLAYFHSRLTSLTRELEVGFAVDDFGVGYSSLARMAELTLTQIKVDRAILHHPLALEELDLVMRVARYARDHGRAPRTVVVEGFDDQSPVTLLQLYDHNVRYVQGFVSGIQASSFLLPLDDAAKSRIAGALERGTQSEVIG